MAETSGLRYVERKRGGIFFYTRTVGRSKLVEFASRILSSIYDDSTSSSSHINTFLAHPIPHETCLSSSEQNLESVASNHALVNTRYTYSYTHASFSPQKFGSLSSRLGIGNETSACSDLASSLSEFRTLPIDRRSRHVTARLALSPSVVGNAEPQ